MLAGCHADLSFLACFLQATYPGEDFQYPIWWGNSLIAILYTTLMFFDEIPEDKREIFSRYNKMGLPQVLIIHVSFLALLFVYLHVAMRVEQRLPPWMTRRMDFGDGYTSIADSIVFFGALLLFVWEKLWLVSRLDVPEDPLK